MTGLRRVLPFPLLSIVVMLLWLALAPSVTAGQVALGALLALLLPWLTARFWPDPPRIRRFWPGVRLLCIVMIDIVVANAAVARLVLGPITRLRPAFVTIPLEITDRFVATILGSIVSLTPGTVSVEIDTENRTLLVHALDVADAQQLIHKIKQRYEAPLREIFAC